ncbi:glutamate--cysteine ligase [compost metagenome]
MREIAGEVLDISHAGLTARARLDGDGANETGFLDPLREIVRSGKVPAELLLEKFHGAWADDISLVYERVKF